MGLLFSQPHTYKLPMMRSIYFPALVLVFALSSDASSSLLDLKRRNAERCAPGNAACTDNQSGWCQDVSENHSNLWILAACDLDTIFSEGEKFGTDCCRTCCKTLLDQEDDDAAVPTNSTQIDDGNDSLNPTTTPTTTTTTTTDSGSGIVETDDEEEFIMLNTTTARSFLSSSKPVTNEIPEVGSETLPDDAGSGDSNEDNAAGPLMKLFGWGE